MPHAEQVRNHARWRPGWSAGRTGYAWLLPLGDHPELRELANQYQYALRDLPGFDPVPLEWMHILLQEVGFTDEVPVERTDALLEAGRARLSGASPLELTFHDGVVLPESLALPAAPQAVLTGLRSSLREASADVVTEAALPPEPEETDQHVSLAHPTADGPAAFAAATLSATVVEPVTVRVPSVFLVELTRDHFSNEWKTLDRIELGN
ncbi:2'-5' RNA ligase [Halopolyspora algeriensis]|uniref:2'-5' RNA ligase n=1 Tax=Halopolyspora algeriensis TaxID=1500506 RepID=A0A368VTL9_9ACTN|nr:2'-5' RNA ligase family protein [Halopolyspora algeriensis]RCW45095.1 2'-5' RNA ligase [Halopolyspora algeriensis]TQM53183.1 2'-5' RNA ligase [Halopolyspora algeriensis]